MTVTVGTMALPVPEDADLVRTYLNGTHVSGGLWTALTRASNHDHTGGANGTPISVSSIPDGSITTGKLDPSVLLPYALVDGSKPFTGQVTMQADAVVRDALYFGQQGTALAPDVTLSRTGAGALRVDTSLGVGAVPPAAGVGALLFTAGYSGSGTGGSVRVVDDGGTTRYVLGLSGAVGARDFLLYDQVRAATVASVGAASGTLTLTPASGQAALSATTAAGVSLAVRPGTNAGAAQLSTTNGLELNPGDAHVVPVVHNYITLGTPTLAYSVVYAQTGTLQPSVAAAKEALVPLDPAACYQAAKDVAWYDFRYAPPAYRAPEPPPDLAYDAADDNETKAEKKSKRDEAEAQAKGAYARMLVETAPARNQRGFVYPAGAESKDEAGGTLPPVPDLFGLSDRESTTPQADLATLGCALQHVIARLEALEGTAA